MPAVLRRRSPPAGPRPPCPLCEPAAFSSFHYTTVLNVVFLALAAVLVWRLGRRAALAACRATSDAPSDRHPRTRGARARVRELTRLQLSPAQPGDARVVLEAARMSNDASGVGGTWSGAGRGGLRGSARWAAGDRCGAGGLGRGSVVGRLVGRVAAGHRAWSRDSIVQPYSVSKPFVAVCELLLVQRGELELDAAVQRYWPEFRAKATVRQVLSHQAGVVALAAPAPTELFFDWDEMCRRLAAEPPAWEPGTAVGESALFYGHLVGELVRRADGRRIGAFLRDEVTAPLGLDLPSGCPGRIRPGPSSSRVSTRISGGLGRASLSCTSRQSGIRPGRATARWSTARGGTRQRFALSTGTAPPARSRDCTRACWSRGCWTGRCSRKRLACRRPELTGCLGSMPRSVSDSASMTMASGWGAWAAASAPRAETVTRSHS